MKFKAKELGLLTLPLLLIAGATLWRSGGKNLNFASNPFEKGPWRLETSGFHPVDLSPNEVSDGYDLKFEGVTQEKGQLIAPPGWVAKPGEIHESVNPRLVYRQGGKWKKPILGSVRIGIGERSTLSVNLKDVPKDADEIRVRGFYQRGYHYKVPFPPAYYGKNPGAIFRGRDIILKSNDFDVPVKMPGQNLVLPTRPQNSPLEVRGVTFTGSAFGKSYGNVGGPMSFYIHLRHSQNPNWSVEAWVITKKIAAFDGKNRPIPLFWNDGNGKPRLSKLDEQRASQLAQSNFSPDKLNSDVVNQPLSSNLNPQRSWDTYPQPIHITYEATDGKCWPVKVDAVFDLRKAPVPLEKFGAPTP